MLPPALAQRTCCFSSVFSPLLFLLLVQSLFLLLVQSYGVEDTNITACFQSVTDSAYLLPPITSSAWGDGGTIAPHPCPATKTHPLFCSSKVLLHRI